MQWMAIVNRVCYVVCIVSIVVGAVFAYLGIWSEMDSEMVWRGLLSSVVAFGACALTVAVNSQIGTRIVLDRAPPPCR